MPWRCLNPHTNFSLTTTDLIMILWYFYFFIYPSLKFYINLSSLCSHMLMWGIDPVYILTLSVSCQIIFFFTFKISPCSPVTSCVLCFWTLSYLPHLSFTLSCFKTFLTVSQYKYAYLSHPPCLENFLFIVSYYYYYGLSQM